MKWLDNIIDRVIEKRIEAIKQKIATEVSLYREELLAKLKKELDKKLEELKGKIEEMIKDKLKEIVK